MPPKQLVDLTSIDFSRVEGGPEDVRKYNPQRYEMEHLNGIIAYRPDQGFVVGFKDVRADEFWVKGHIPGRPLFPGVLMCECAAQLSSYYFKRSSATGQFVGFGGLNEVKFRGQVVPGDKLIMIARNTELNRRRAIFDCQGLVNGKVVFEGTVIGMPM